jgi:hypothetical protein
MKMVNMPQRSKKGGKKGSMVESSAPMIEGVGGFQR